MPQYKTVVPRPLLNNGMLKEKNYFNNIKVVSKMNDQQFIVFKDVFTSQECDTLVELMQQRLQKSYVFDNATGASIIDTARTSQGAYFQRGEYTSIDILDTRLARLCDWPLSHTEQMQFLQYGENEYYVPHYDFFHLDQPGSKVTLDHAGNRVATVIVYLQEPEEGGSTFFPDLDLHVMPVKGSAVFFSYDRPHTDTLTLHSGEPVTKGVKCIATKWFRERVFQQV